MVAISFVTFINPSHHPTSFLTLRDPVVSSNSSCAVYHSCICIMRV